MNWQQEILLLYICLNRIMELVFLVLCMFLVAMIYAAVGHGGASGYLALMALFAVSVEVMKPMALLLNIFVSSLAFFHFYRGGHFRWSIFWPIALASIPMAFWGGSIHLNPLIYKRILGIFLMISAVVFILNRKFDDGGLKSEIDQSKTLSLLMGGGIGFVSGLIAIGGGVLLSPILLFLRWTNQKLTAAIAAGFILVNSVSGLLGQLMNTSGGSVPLFYEDLHFLNLFKFGMIPVLLGGYLGARWGAKILLEKQLRWILSLVLLIASIKLLLT